MDLFHQIEDAEAIVRLKGGVHKQLKLYRRRDRIFIGISGGYLRVCAKFGDTWGTANPSINVIDMTDHVPGLSLAEGREPRWTGRSTS